MGLFYLFLFVLLLINEENDLDLQNDFKSLFVVGRKFVCIHSMFFLFEMEIMKAFHCDLGCIYAS